MLACDPAMTSQPTGYAERRDGVLAIVVSRQIEATIDDVWGWITTPDKLEQWIGTWSGDPAQGVVDFLMLAEGADKPEPMRVRTCVPPTTLHVTAESTMGHWLVNIDLEEASARTTLSLTHLDVPADMLGAVGAGWEYYVDRLVAALRGDDVAAIDFEADYFPALADRFSIPPEG